MTKISKSKRVSKYLMNKQKINKYFNMLGKINSNDIMAHHNMIKDFTGCNLNNNNPTACGNTANAILNISIQHFNKQKSDIETYNRPQQLIKLIKKNKWLNKIIIYNIGIWSNNPTFLGHSFIIAKLPNHEYVLLQSYVNQYLFSEWLKYNNFILISYRQILKIINKLNKFIHDGTIDDNFINFWKDLTNVEYNKIPNEHYNDIQFSARVLFIDL